MCLVAPVVLVLSLRRPHPGLVGFVVAAVCSVANWTYVMYEAFHESFSDCSSIGEQWSDSLTSPRICAAESMMDCSGWSNLCSRPSLDSLTVWMEFLLVKGTNISGCPVCSSHSQRRTCKDACGSLTATLAWVTLSFVLVLCSLHIIGVWALLHRRQLASRRAALSMEVETACYL